MACAILMLAAALVAVPGQRAIYEVTDFVDPMADCGRPLNLHISGPDPICDLSPAFARAISSCVAELDDPWLQGDKLGCSLTIAPGTYELRAPLELCRAHFARGAGGGHWATQTTLRVPKGRGSVMVPVTQYYSSGGQTIRLGYGTTVPPLPDATWPAGSRWERISASATGAPRTWVLGADGAWRVVEAVQ